MANPVDQEIAELVRGQTVATEFMKTVATRGGEPALNWRADDGSWQQWTFEQYAQKVAQVAAGLDSMGVEAGDRVVLMMRNIPAFHVLDMACYFLGATPVSIYNSSSVEQIVYLAGHCEAKLAVAEDNSFLSRFRPARAKLPALEFLGAVDGDGDFDLEELCDNGEIDLAEAVNTPQPDDLATIIYTSGTTGPPKGVMISHANITWTVECLRRATGADVTGFRTISYLPMAHIAERMVSHYQAAFLGIDVNCMPDLADLGATLRDVRPDYMFGVPRVWEKLHAGVEAALAADPDKKAGFDQAVAAAKDMVVDLSWDRATDEQRATYQALDEMAFAGVRALLGLDELKIAVTGAAPIPAELLAWYRAIGVPLSEIYGMSESSGPMTWTPERIKPGTVGPAVPGVELTLADDGEIICRGGNVFQGYLNDPDKTAEAIDAEGWLHSGDIGEIDDDGYVRVVDRKKELIITAGGKNISPANLESQLKMIPLVGQACAIGDQRPFVSALVVIDPDAAQVWCAARGVEFTSLAELADNPDVISEIDAGLEDVMAGFNNAERVKKVTVLHEEWLPDSEELTPTSKLKRRGIHAKYSD
ncbi:MAG: AMP-binding protein, partial [Acidimicrobiia bacterium]|nr:AMP-binding protein [Acidimicrobiia bacterium]